MPLIIVTGYPTSGKTHRSKQLHSYFTTRAATTTTATSKPIQVHHITDDSLSIPHKVYDLSSHDTHERSNNSSEKDARALVYASVKRLLTARDIVILDAAAGNYIKGWRYQLYCEAKALRTPHCVVHVGASKDTCQAINEARLALREEGKASVPGEEAYERDTWENLVFRYEEPNGMTRWDSPLFTVVWDDAEPPCEAIWEALMGSEEGGKPVIRPNAATVVKKGEGEGFLYVLDKGTQEVVTRIVEWGRDHIGEYGGEVVIDVGDGRSVILALPVDPVGLPALQRLRRQFIALNRMNAVGVSRIKESFVGYLNDGFQNA